MLCKPYIDKLFEYIDESFRSYEAIGEENVFRNSLEAFVIRAIIILKLQIL